MINSAQPTYDAIRIPTKPKNDATTRNAVLTVFAIMSALATAGFLYNGFFMKNTSAVSLIRLSPEPIIIEYDADDVFESMLPGSDLWIQFHNQLMEEAGYNAAGLRNSAETKVSFIAYDSVDLGSVTGKPQNRPSAAFTCYTTYSEVGNTNSQSMQNSSIWF